MKKNQKTILAVILIAFVGSIGTVYGQPLNNLMNTANTQASTELTGFKLLMRTVFYFLAGGGFLVAAWAGFFQSDRLKTAIGALITGLLFGAVGAAMSFIG